MNSIYLDNQYTSPPLSTLNDVEFDNLKNCATTKEMWDKISLVHGGYQNVLREKDGSLKGKFDERR